MKKFVFWLMLIAMVAGIIGLLAVVVSNNYTLIVTRKQPFMDFANIERLARVDGITIKKAQTEDLVTVPISRQIELRRIHPYSGFRTEPGVEGIFQYYPLAKKGGEDSSAQPDRRPKEHRFSINQLGFRSPWLGEKKEKGTIRIAMLGGSAVWLGSENETTIVAQLAQLLSSGKRKVEYINGGIVAAVVSQELNVLVQDIVDADVDLVISFDGFNDIMNLLHFNGRIGWPMLLPSNIPEVVYYYPEIPPTQNIDPEKLVLAVAHYLNVIDKMAKICDVFGVRYMAVIQPAKFFVENEDTLDDVKQDPAVAFYQAAISAFAQRDGKRAANAHYVSLAGLVSLDSYWDPVHFGDEGNRLVAKELYKLIVERKILPVQ